ncbi:unnamed protein product [Rotaria sp. Silwood2]|nr:unnamed protein product [Rotaria sp. Silwood2]
MKKKSNNNDDALNVLVTLRLLRVLVRYRQQLRTIFEINLVNVPTKDYPQLILYLVIVGITDDSKMRRIKSREMKIFIKENL